MEEPMRFTPKRLAMLGIEFETGETAAAFAAIVEEEFEVRVGQGVGAYLSARELREFEELDVPLARRWLEEHCPDYRRIVYKTWRRMEEELLRFRAWIPGTAAGGQRIGSGENRKSTGE